MDDYFAFVENFRPNGPVNGWIDEYERKHKPRVRFEEEGALYTVLSKHCTEFTNGQPYISNFEQLKEVERDIDISLLVMEASTGTHDTLDARSELNAARHVVHKALRTHSRIQIVRVK